MALDFAKELLGNAYTEELEQKLEAKISEGYAPKAEVETAAQKAATLEEQLRAANETIGKFDGLDPEKITQEVNGYKQRAEAAEKDRDEKLAESAFSAKLQAAARRAKAKNPELAIGTLDLDTLRKSKNQDADITAAFEARAKSDGYLFGAAEPEPAPAAGTGATALPGQKYTADELAMRTAAGLPTE